MAQRDHYIGVVPPEAPPEETTSIPAADFLPASLLSTNTSVFGLKRHDTGKPKPRPA